MCKLIPFTRLFWVALLLTPIALAQDESLVIRVEQPVPIESESVAPGAPIQNITLYVDQVEINPINMIWHMSVWNRQTGKTDFHQLWMWRGNRRILKPFVIDGSGSRLEAARVPDKVDPVQGERQQFKIIFPSPSDQSSLTLHIASSVRTCKIGLCDYSIAWQPFTVRP